LFYFFKSNRALFLSFDGEFHTPLDRVGISKIEDVDVGQKGERQRSVELLGDSKTKKTSAADTGLERGSFVRFGGGSQRDGGSFVRAQFVGEFGTNGRAQITSAVDPLVVVGSDNVGGTSSQEKGSLQRAFCVGTSDINSVGFSSVGSQFGFNSHREASVWKGTNSGQSDLGLFGFDGDVIEEVSNRDFEKGNKIGVVDTDLVVELELGFLNRVVEVGGHSEGGLPDVVDGSVRDSLDREFLLEVGGSGDGGIDSLEFGLSSPSMPPAVFWLKLGVN